VLVLSLPLKTVARTCQNITVPVEIEARNGIFNLLQPQTNLDVTHFALNATSNRYNFTKAALTGYQTVTGTYNISVTFCQPDTAKSGAIQVLTHGIGFDKTCAFSSFDIFPLFFRIWK
jgi:hypothetical protein